jgi:hypothetical protein
MIKDLAQEFSAAYSPAFSTTKQGTGSCFFALGNVFH